MLIGIPSLLGPDLLAALRSMGHGDEVAVVDGNYPALEHARRLIRADGHGLVAVLEAILTVLPLDDDRPDAVVRTGWQNGIDRTTEIHRQIDALIGRVRPGRGIRPLPGQEFYGRVRGAHLVIATSEPALFANVILRKGVIPASGTPDVRPLA